jgi:hypothetical protein
MHERKALIAHSLSNAKFPIARFGGTESLQGQQHGIRQNFPFGPTYLIASFVKAGQKLLSCGCAALSKISHRCSSVSNLLNYSKCQKNNIAN